MQKVEGQLSELAVTKYKQVLKDYITISSGSNSLCDASKCLEELEYIAANTRFYNEKSDTFNAGVAFGMLMNSGSIGEISPVELHKIYTRFTNLVGVYGKCNV